MNGHLVAQRAERTEAILVASWPRTASVAEKAICGYCSIISRHQLAQLRAASLV